MVLRLIPDCVYKSGNNDYVSLSDVNGEIYEKTYQKVQSNK